VRVGSLTGVVAVAAGAYHSLVLLGDGTVRAWGANTYGQLGDGTTTRRTSPVTVPGLSGVETVTAGRAYSAAL
jgi:alpha-tubulin suppressor-like RCC1 family protein